MSRSTTSPLNSGAHRSVLGFGKPTLTLLGRHSRPAVSTLRWQR
jgi:hypothetical protein